MAITLNDLRDYIKEHVDPNDLIEYLDIPTEVLVDKLAEEIDNKFDYLIQELELGNDDPSDSA